MKKLIIINGRSLEVQELLNQLAASQLSINKVSLIADSDRVGEIHEFAKEALLVGRMEDIPESGYDAAILMSEVKDLESFTRLMVESKIPVIDAAGSFTDNTAIPLFIRDYWPSTLPMVSRLPSIHTSLMGSICKALDGLSNIERIMMYSVHGVSGHGSKGAMDELFEQTKSILEFGDTKVKLLPKQTVFNMYPSQNSLDMCARSQSEMRQIMSKDNLEIDLEASWGCFFAGIAGSIWMETAEPVDLVKVEECLSNAAGIKIESSESIPGVLDSVGKDYIIVSGIRLYRSDGRGLTLRFVMDNLSMGLEATIVQTLQRFL